jgi:hypothetical protein
MIIPYIVKVYSKEKVEAGCEKINFTRGEPFLIELGMMIQQCKKLGIVVSIISNASCSVHNG